MSTLQSHFEAQVEKKKKPGTCVGVQRLHSTQYHKNLLRMYCVKPKGREKKKIFLKATFKELHEYVCIIVMHIPFTF